MTQPNQSEIEQQIVEYATTLLEASRTNDYQLELENRRLLTAYITANYTLTSEVAERERVARIDALRHIREFWGAARDETLSSKPFKFVSMYDIDNYIAELTKEEEL